MPRTPLTPEQLAERRTRVSSYQARIERTLTSFYEDVPTERQAGQEWHLVGVGHTRGHATCELCGHNPIRRLFWIQRVGTDDTLMIGSECARNYVRVDLVDAYMTRIVRAANHRRNAEERALRTERRRASGLQQQAERIVARQAEATAWVAANADVIAFLRELPTDLRGNTFLVSVGESLERYTSLTERQTAAVRRFMERQPTTTEAPAPSGPAAAEGAQVPHIYNGVYTVDAGGEHMTFKIHTALRGPLAGKRIVKRMTSYGQFEGFGFLNVDGGLNLWRRFDGDAGAPYVRWARTLLEGLGTDSVRSSMQRGLGRCAWTASNGTVWTVNVSTVCRCCNRALTTPTSVERGIGPDCESRHAGENRTEPAAHSTAGAARRSVGRPAPRTATAVQGTLALSELATGEVR